MYQSGKLYSITRFTAILFGLATITLPLTAQEQYPLEEEIQTANIDVFLPFLNGVQQVTVSVVDGEYLLEGDIVVQPIGDGRGGAASADDDHLWPNSVIPYIINSGHPHAATIRRAAQNLSNRTNLCLYEITSTSGVGDYIRFRYVSNKCGSSPIGRQGGEQIVKVGDRCANTFGSTMHEILHSAGFYHEQSRDDRDDFVTINFDNIEDGHEHNFEKYNDIPIWSWLFPDGQNIGDYDYGSIMHYPRTAFGKEDASGNRMETITPGRSGVTMGQRSNLSSGDINSINTLYSTSGSCSSSSSTASSDAGRGGAGAWEYDATNIDIVYDVQLVPQRTGMSCWAAGTAMLVGWRDRVSIDPEEIAAGIDYWAQYRNAGLDANDTTMFAAWGLETEPPQTYTVQGLVDLLAYYGPLWVATAEPGPHIRVISAIQGDGTPDGTVLTIYDPWQRGMRRFRMPNPGSIYTETFSEFMRKQNELAERELNEPAPLYLAHN